VRRFLLTLRRFLRKAADVFPFTPLGLLLLGAAGASTWYFGFTKMDLVVLAMGSAALGVGAVALVVTSLTAVVLYRGLRTGFSVSSLWFLPLVEVKWTWQEPRARAELVRWKRRLWETVTATRRGTYEAVARRVEVSDAFRLTKIVFELREARTVRALPGTGALKKMQVIRSLASGDDMHDPMGAAEGDRLDLRNYVPGDPVRYILWRVFAKTRTVVVRTPERAVAMARRAYAYVVADDADEPAAGAARVAIESGAIGHDWVFGADGVSEHADTKTKALQVLADSAKCPVDRRGADLAGFLQRHATMGRVVVFVPGKPGPWLDRVAAAAGARRGGHGARVEFVVCVDGVVPSAKKGWRSRLADYNAPSVSEGLDDGWVSVETEQLDTVVAKLGAARGRVVLAERRAGRVYDVGALRKALEPAPEARP
jgi:hypothetical protein